MTVILMSRSEIDRMNVLRDLAEERIRVSEAATLIGLGRRQVLRLAKAFRQRGPAALASRRRGKPSNRSYPGVLRTEVTGIIRECYADFGPTLAGEKLAELHGIRLARETIRQWMMVAGLWKDRRQRMRPVHQPRPCGRLTQMFCGPACAADFMLIADNSVRSGSRNVWI